MEFYPTDFPKEENRPTPPKTGKSQEQDFHFMLCQKVADISAQKKPNFWRRFLHFLRRD
jgi:hypothetical protein